jgi:hypothetical protein
MAGWPLISLPCGECAREQTGLQNQKTGIFQSRLHGENRSLLGIEELAILCASASLRLKNCVLHPGVERLNFQA